MCSHHPSDRSPSRKAIIPQAETHLVYNIQYYSTSQSHHCKHPPHLHTARDPWDNQTMVYREMDPNAVRARLNKEKLTAEDKGVLKELGFDYEKLRSTPARPNATDIMDYPNNGYE